MQQKNIIETENNNKDIKEELELIEKLEEFGNNKGFGHHAVLILDFRDPLKEILFTLESFSHDIRKYAYTRLPDSD
jgi:hypothetical protein